MSSAAGKLTQHDNAVLSQLFDPEAAPSDVKIDPSLPADPHVTDPKLLEEVRHREKLIVLSVEQVMREPTKTREKDRALRQAQVDLIALQAQYKYAGLWNDLAQVIRLQLGDDILLASLRTCSSSPCSSSPATVESANLVIEALDTVINLLAPSSAQLRVSPSQARIMSSALLQRGALFNAAYKHLLREPNAEAIIKKFQGWKKDDFQEAASEAFFNAGRLGNELGKALAVHTNPTAKLCGQMVQDAMRREFAPLRSG
ncbi:MAG: hypothetical protein MMC23_007527 [Stictis urceolatum]|nr:hypothetical protein [Stictis urceolata]